MLVKNVGWVDGWVLVKGLFCVSTPFWVNEHIHFDSKQPTLPDDVHILPFRDPNSPE